jgi:hypothetical protein
LSSAYRLSYPHYVRLAVADSTFSQPIASGNAARMPENTPIAVFLSTIFYEFFKLDVDKIDIKREVSVMPLAAVSYERNNELTDEAATV